MKEYTHLQVVDPSPILPGHWKAFPGRDIPELFNEGHIYHYLVESLPQVEVLGALVRKFLQMCEGPGRGAEKISRAAKKIFKSKFVKRVMDSELRGNYFVKAFVRASMRKQEYFTYVVISMKSGSVVDAKCECDAQALKRCSHVAALLFYIIDHANKHGYVGEYFLNLSRAVTGIPAMPLMIWGGYPPQGW